MVRATGRQHIPDILGFGGQIPGNIPGQDRPHGSAEGILVVAAAVG
jgi:hypothetical protein